MKFEDWMKEATAEAELEDAKAQRVVAILRDKLRQETRKTKLAEMSAAHADARLANIITLNDAPKKRIAKFVPLSKARKHRNRGMPLFMLSDYHVEENVDPRTVENLNKYTPEIAQKRLEYLFEGFAWHSEMYARTWDVTDVCLWLGGDLITGHIHEELLESNWLSPIEASLLCMQLLIDCIEYLLNRCKFIERLYIPCNFGNHGRTTPRRRISTGAKNSFEWLMYNVLKRHFESNPRVQFDIAGGDLLHADLYGRKVRFHHGDDIGYQGGVGGLTIPLRKKTDSWDTSIEADFTVIGHWHQFVDYGYSVVNGSVIGWSPYCIKIGARYELPQQGALIICEQRGKTAVCGVKCDPERKAA